jgi:hypothetical protein
MKTRIWVLVSAWVGFWTFLRPAEINADEPIRLQEQYLVGSRYHVSTRTDLSGRMTLPAEKAGELARNAPKTLAVTGTSAIEYDERVLSLDKDGAAQKTIRLYRRIDFQRKVGDRPQESTIRPAVRRLVILRRQPVEVPFSPDGPLLWGEIDLVRTDVFAPALAGLLPGQAVRRGDRWKARTAAVQELTDMERIEEGGLECGLEEVAVVAGRRQARVGFSGSVRGVNEDGPNRQQLDGYFYFDLESQHLSYLYLKGVHSLLDKDGKAAGVIEGQFVLTRQAAARCPELDDEALKGTTLEPTPENTRLLYDNPDVGVRFLYPRRWRVSGVRGRQVTVDEAGGSGVLITPDLPEKLPTGRQYLAEVQDWLRKQKAQVWRTEPLRSLEGAPAGSETFALEADISGQRVRLHYYVVRQKNGGATLAARLLPRDLEALQRDLESLIRSLVITPVPQR